MNTEIKHTPGPWEVAAYGAKPLHLIWSKDEFPTLIARTCFAPTSKGNATLIAACPEMYDLLKEICKISGTEGAVWYQTMNVQKKAISLLNKIDKS